MIDMKRVKYLKIDRGRYNYQRRVPKHLQPLFEETTWCRPCGNVTYAKAVQLVVGWAEEDDAFIDRMKDPTKFQSFKTNKRREHEDSEREFILPPTENYVPIVRIYGARIQLASATLPTI